MPQTATINPQAARPKKSATPQNSVTPQKRSTPAERQQAGSFADTKPLAPTQDARIALAPMEGVVDAGVRQLISEIGGVDFCVTEFMRVTTELQPRRAFMRICPELLTASQTPQGTPVHFQLLGSDPQLLAAHAEKAAALGAQVVDLNFGCPAKTVNRHKGGAVLLQTPELIHDIVTACSKALAATPARLTAKMRLGYEDTRQAYDNLSAIEEGGATELVVHARTKTDGYKPPAHWQWLDKLRAVSHIPIIGNGEIWSPDDYWRCRDVSGCTDLMLGRGLLADPYLARRILDDNPQLPSQADLSAALLIYLRRMQLQDYPGKFLLARGKQWLGMIKKGLVPVDSLFDAVKTCRDAEQMFQLLEQSAAGECHYAHYLPE
ncbi:tRNA dihydrouridine synthase [Oceanospirillum sp.]|uniref:tRNA dihydrouridine synthase n=1 Tax=Oceanospirillum sp. TaxID=2021254 RepID=UPI003A94D54A